MLYINAKVVTMEGRDIPCGYIKTDGKTIAEVGDMAELEFCEEAIDLKGKSVYPGFVDAHCHLGMWEDGIDFEGADGNEDTDPIMPNLRAIDAVNPMDRCFEEAASAGITTVLTGPGSANPIAGSFIAMKTYGRQIDKMILKDPAGIKFSLGENPKNSYSDKNQTPITRMGIAALIREQLEKAKRYLEEVKSAKAEDEEMPEYDAKCEALIPLLEGKIKAFFHCHRADDIFTAIRIAKEFSLRLVLIHATEGHLVSKDLDGIDVICGPIICDRSKPEVKNHSIESVGKIKQYAKNVAVCTDHPEVPIQYLGISCALAVKGGLKREDALEAITISAARICGIDDRVGSIKAGKDADFVVFDESDDPFSPYASPKMVIVNGKQI